MAGRTDTGCDCRAGRQAVGWDWSASLGGRVLMVESTTAIISMDLGDGKGEGWQGISPLMNYW
ncbi:hypothetical protein LIA77_10956 [Sarocladium implicatum]|nr:hypothetical protein LIA77_10956 [Sarocladium implicatum]